MVPLESITDSDPSIGSMMSSDPNRDGKAKNNEQIESPSDDTKSDEEKEQIGDQESIYKDWPLKDIKEPLPTDVMCGRGAGTNRHNKRFRAMVEGYKKEYVRSKRNEKKNFAFAIIRKWRAQSPPGRFLAKDKETKLWYDLGDGEAKKKVIQLLREGAPGIRKEEGIPTRNDLTNEPAALGKRCYTLGGSNHISPLEEEDDTTVTSSLRSVVSLPSGPFRETSMGTFPTHLHRPAVVTPSQNTARDVEATNSWLGGGWSSSSLNLSSSSLHRGRMQPQLSDSSILSVGKRGSWSSEITMHDGSTDSTRIKRASLNRDKSAATNRLKQQFCPEVFDLDLQSLYRKTEQIDLSPSTVEINDTISRPSGLTPGSRITTEQAVKSWAIGKTSDHDPTTTETHQTISKPGKFDQGSRVTTIEAMANWATLSQSDMEFFDQTPHTDQNGADLSRSHLARQTTNMDALENCFNKGVAQRPTSLTKGDRKSTMDSFNFDIDDL